MNKNIVQILILIALLGLLVRCGKEVITETVVVTKIEPCTTIPDPNGLGFLLQCGDMEPVLILHGQQGLPGADGQDGIDGADGVDGQDGQDGADGSIIKLVTPCPELGLPEDYPEALVCLNDERLFAVYDDGKKGQVRLVELIEGQWYETTDKRECSFKVEAQCQLSY